jgi:thymidine phosphorylase
MAVGIHEIVPLGRRLGASDPLAVVHAADEASAEAAAVLLQKAFQIGQTKGEQAPVVSQRLTAKDL